MKLHDVIIQYVINGKIITKTIADVHDEYFSGSSAFEVFHTGGARFKIRRSEIITLDEFNFREFDEEE